MRVIVRVREHPDAYRTRVEALGGHVLRTLRLVPALVVDAPKATVERLRKEPWVVRVEPDEEVSAQDNPSI